MVLKMYIVNMDLTKNVEGRRLLEFCNKKELYVANT